MQNDTIGIPDGFSNCQNKFGILNFLVIVIYLLFVICNLVFFSAGI